MKKVFLYIEPIWLDNSNKKISLRSVAAIALLIDFIINLHNSAAIVTKVLKLLFIDKPVDSTLIAAMSGNLAQIAMMLITEAGLIAAMLALKTFQPIQPDFKAETVQTQTKTQTITKPKVEPPDDQPTNI